jgi:CPA2 family monovalent cation:H+ antiporter-2
VPQRLSAEFSVILAGLGIELNLLPEANRDVILAGAMLSVLLNPILAAAADRLLRALLTTHGQNAPLQETASPNAPKLAPSSLTNHAVLVGHGRVGSLVAKTLDEMGQC